MITIIWSTALILGILITIHEYGHFKAARSVGVRVEKFSIGIPPRFIQLKSLNDFIELKVYFFKWSKGKLKWDVIYTKQINKPGRKGSKTEYVIALLPIGGYVKMAGMLDESLDSNVQYKDDEFIVKSYWEKIWILSAGVLMNVFLAFIIFATIGYFQGKSEVLNEPIISELKEGMPAEVAGMLPGDEIKFINDKSVSTWDDLTSIIHSLPEEEISMVIKRGDELIDYDLKTMSSPFPNGTKVDTIGLIGISPVIIYSDISLLDAIGVGYSRTIGSFGMMIMSINMLISGSASVSDFGGPIMIAQLAGETAEAGWIPFFTFMALISVNLAFINILPIPGLDGGHIFLHTIEAIIRRPLTLRTRIVIQQIGMSFLLLLMLTVMFNDINRFF